MRVRSINDFITISKTITSNLRVGRHYSLFKSNKTPKRHDLATKENGYWIIDFSDKHILSMGHNFVWQTVVSVLALFFLI